MFKLRILSVLFCLLVLPFTLVAAVTYGQESSSLTVVGLKCEYLVNPLGIDELSPRFSWRLESKIPGAKNQSQTAWRLLVADSRETLTAGAGNCWDSGWIASKASSQIEYTGARLISDHRYYWTVTIKDQNGNVSAPAVPASFTTGLFNPDEWSAEWIGSIVPEDREKPISDQTNARNDPWLRKTFELKEVPVQGQLFLASIGYHELYVNGQKIDNGVLAPAVSDHSRRARYMTYELAPLLRKGKNVIAVWLATGWAPFLEYERSDKPKAPIMLAQADLHFQQGAPLRIISDASWKTHKSPSNFMGTCFWNDMGGEHFDARDDRSDWFSVELDDSDWSSVTVFPTKLALSSQMIPVNRVFEEILPVAIVEIGPSVWRVDMGRNYAGWLQAHVTGNPGDYIHFGFSEHADQKMTFNNQCAYTIGSKGEGTFHSRFNYASGRWITITGLANKPKLTDLKGFSILTYLDAASDFECSDDLQNWMYKTCMWTFRNLSLGGQIVDCPQRERLGYGGDAHATCETGMYNFGMAAFYTKWLQDWRDVQMKKNDGSLPNTAPTHVGGGGPSWGGIVITLPWFFYQQYGDLRILERNFELMSGWLAFIKSNVKDNLLVQYGDKWEFLGDWLWPGAPDNTCYDTDETLCFNNCYRVFNLRTAAKIARLLNKPEQAEQWELEAKLATIAINTRWFHDEDASWSNGWMSILSAGLLGHVAEPDKEPAIWKRLEKEILVNHKGHIGSGITGGSILFKLLRNNYRNDLISTMTSKTDYPSWGFMRENGATTYWEAWELNRPAHSLLHSSYLFPGAWYIDSVLGIRSAKDGHGFQHIVICPPKPGSTNMTWAKGSYDSEYGTISVSWKDENGRRNMTVSIPPNTSGTVVLHTPDGPVEKKIGSGTWNF